MSKLKRAVFAIALLGLSASVWADTVVVGQVSGEQGEEISVPITLPSNASEIATIDIDVTFDTDQLELRAGGTACGFIEAGSALNTQKHGLGCSTPSTGVLRVLVNSLPALGNPPVVALTAGQQVVLRFTIKSDATKGVTTALGTANTNASDTSGNTIAGITFTAGAVEVLDLSPAIGVSPASLNFTAENGSTSAAQTITVTNSGNQDGLLITGATVPSGSRFNVASNNCPSTAPGLAQQATCTIGVTFSPNAIDSFSDTLTIASNAGNATVELTGTGTAGPAGALTIAPTSHNFGTLLTDQGTATQSFTVTNSGAAGSVVTVGTPAIAGAGMTIVSGNTCASATLAQGASCSVTVQFAPAADGAVSGGELTVSGTDANSTSLSASATLSGAGETKAIFRSTPAAGSSQTEVAGAEGEASFTISLFNDGNASYAFTSALTSGDSDIFTITGGAGTVAAFSDGSAGSSTITVSCELPDFETYEGTVTVTVGDETYEYGFTCVGRPPLPVPTMSVWSLSLMALMLMLMAGFGMRTVRARR